MAKQISNKSPSLDPRTAERHSRLEEISGAFGDLGTFIPHTLGAITVAGLAPAGVFTGFGLFYVASGLFYRLPIPVQPMKAVSAVMLTSGLSAAEIAATGVLIGIALIVLGWSGIIARLACAIPQTVITGLQLGLGIRLGWLALQMMGENGWLGTALLVLLVFLLRIPRMPASLVALALAVLVGQLINPGKGWTGWQPAIILPALVFPGVEDWQQALRVSVLPQLALTLTNAIIVTAAISQEFFGSRAYRVTPTHLSLSSGLANLVLAPLGALPMCHGAGGLAAHYRFGARTGAAPLLLGAILLLLGLLFSKTAVALLEMIPTAAVGALLLLSSIELAWSKRLVDARPVCRLVIGITAAVIVFADPFWGLLTGWGVELIGGRFGMSRRGSSVDR